DRIAAARPRIVGFTSVFQQHLASLALARRLKARLPGTVVVIGGANCGATMGVETIRQFPFVDAIVSGEAGHGFPELAARVAAADPIPDLPGVVTQATPARSAPASPTAAVTDLDGLPFPEYRDYFHQFARSRFAGRWQPSVFVETSRGCWWGERMHCTF